MASLNERIGKKIIEATVHRFRRLWDEVPILFPAIVYFSVWSVIAYLRIHSLYATYFDLGAFQERLWQVYHLHWTFLNLLFVFSNTGLQFFIFPLALGDSYLLLGILQSIAIGLCSIPLYLISKMFGHTKLQSFIIASSFLIYFPVAGSNIFDVHFQSFFPIFFLTAYYYFLRRQYLISLILFFIAGSVRYPYFLFPSLFAILALVEHQWRARANRKSSWLTFDRRTVFLVSLLAVSLIFLTIRVESAGLFTALNIATHASSATAYDFRDRMLAFILLVGPLGFIPILSRRWLLFYAPMFYLIFSGPSIYYYPFLFNDQYAILIYPFLYLGLIEALAWLKGLDMAASRFRALKPWAGRRRFLSRTKNKTIAFLVAVFVVLILLDSVFEPYGPFNSTSKVDFHFGAMSSVNQTQYNAVNEVVRMIPGNDPYVLTQNNLIELYPRTAVPPGSIGGIPLIAGMLNIGVNLTSSEIASDRFPVMVGNSLYGFPINYILADISSSWFYFDSAGFPSMATLLNETYTSGQYGILAEVAGIILLERNYTGQPQLFRPMYLEFSPSEFYVNANAVKLGNRIVTENSNTSINNGEPIWYGPYTSLFPGNYEAHYLLSTSNISQENMVLLDVNSLTYFVKIKTVTGSDFSATGKIVDITFYFHINSFMNYMEFRGMEGSWNGMLSFYGVAIQQLSP